MLHPDIECSRWDWFGTAIAVRIAVRHPLWIAEVFVSVEYLKLPMSITTEAQNFAPTVRKKFLGSAAMRPGPG
jgi:hypothetical protein